MYLAEFLQHPSRGPVVEQGDSNRQISYSVIVKNFRATRSQGSFMYNGEEITQLGAAQDSSRTTRSTSSHSSETPYCKTAQQKRCDAENTNISQ